MSAKACILWALLLTVLTASTATCADPLPPPAAPESVSLASQLPDVRERDLGVGGMGPTDPASYIPLRSRGPIQFAPPGANLFAGPDGTMTPTPQPPAQPDNWITYQQPGCCGPRGRNGPVTYELYIRTGPSLPVGPGDGLASTLEVGWYVQAGGRTLFFNPACTSAWVVDLGVGNIWNHGNQPDRTYFIPQSIAPVATLALNRTYGAIGGGKEWYLLGPADNCNWNWRFGFDGGGQLGTMRLDLRDPAAPNGSNYRRRNSAFGGLYTGLFTDVTIPCQSCSFTTGFRAEWSYNFNDIVVINSDISSVNLLWTLGVRF